MPLTDTAIKAFKPEAKPRKYADGGGLFLLVQPHGSKLWRMKYRFDGKEKLLSFGDYPAVSLRAARARREDARELLAQGIDPSEHRKEAKAQRMAETEHTLEAIAREWFATKAPGWAPSHADKIIRRLERDIFPWLGGEPITAITAPALLNVIRRIESRGNGETAHRALQDCGQVFRYGIVTGRCERDPAADLRGALAPVQVEHFAAIIDPVELGALLRAIDAFRGTLVVQSALKIAPLLFVRPGELRKAEWSEFDFDKAEWSIPAERMKARRAHMVPLASQAVAILKALQPLTGRQKHVFAGRDPMKPMSDAAVNAALRRMGYNTKTEITGHGFRAGARTILHEVLGVDAAVIEHQLAHAVPDALGAAYNRTKFLPQRRAMMQQWADYLDKIKAGADVLALPKRDAA